MKQVKNQTVMWWMQWHIVTEWHVALCAAARRRSDPGRGPVVEAWSQDEQPAGAGAWRSQGPQHLLHKYVSLCLYRLRPSLCLSSRCLCFMSQHNMWKIPHSLVFVFVGFTRPRELIFSRFIHITADWSTPLFTFKCVFYTITMTDDMKYRTDQSFPLVSKHIGISLTFCSK